MKKLLFVLLILLFFISNVSASAFITADEVTETSILWNVSNILSTKSIAYITLDGIKVNNYYNTSRIVQNNLYASEAHIITVNTTDGNRYEEKAYTLDSEQTNFMRFVNQYIFIILILFVLIIAFFTEPYIAFISFIISFIGLTTTINFSFELGTIFVILMCASFFIAVKGDG